MTRLETSAWTVPGGSASVFALAIVLDRLPWQVAFAAVALAVLAWAWQGPVTAGVALGGIAWLCVTGFDVNAFGRITVPNVDDVGRAALLVLGGLAAASAHAVIDAARRHRRADLAWVDSAKETFTEPTDMASDAARPLLYQVPLPRGAARQEPSARATEETRDG